MLSLEKPLVKPMGSILHHKSFRSVILVYYLFYFAIFTFQSIQQKHQKYYLIIFIRSHFCKWPWRDWQPILSHWLQGSWLFVQVLGDLRVISYWIIPWFSKTEGNTYATLLHHPFLFKGKPTHAQEAARGDTNDTMLWPIMDTGCGSRPGANLPSLAASGRGRRMGSP